MRADTQRSGFGLGAAAVTGSCVCPDDGVPQAITAVVMSVAMTNMRVHLRPRSPFLSRVSRRGSDGSTKREPRVRGSRHSQLTTVRCRALRQGSRRSALSRTSCSSSRFAGQFLGYAVEPSLAVLACFSSPMCVWALLPLREGVDPPRECLDHRVMALADLDGRAVRIVAERNWIDVMAVNGSPAFSAEKLGCLATSPRKIAPAARVIRSRVHERSRTKRS